MGTWRISSANIFRSTWATHPSRDENHLPLSGTRCVREAWFGDAGATALKSRCVRGSAIKRRCARGRENARLRMSQGSECGGDDVIPSWHRLTRGSLASAGGSRKCCAGCFQSLPPRWRFCYWFEVGLEHPNGCTLRGQSARGTNLMRDAGVSLPPSPNSAAPVL